jgi:Lrp/AsnC family leucine-responsive transcriptional regulator
MEKPKLDTIDLKILSGLETDGRMSFSALGEQVGLSKTPCWTRVKDLEERNVIERYSAVLSPAALGLHVSALVHIVVSFDAYQAFEAAIQAHPSIYACHAVTGDYDYVLEVYAFDMQALDTLLRDDLRCLPGVERFSTSISMRRIKGAAPFSNML